MSDKPGKYENLLNLGLNELESKVYLHLMERGSSSALSLSRSLVVPRTSIYDTLTRLAEKGLIERVVKAKSTLYKASSVSIFESLIKSQLEKAQAMEKSLDSLKLQLKPGVGDLKSTEVRYYQGAEGMRQMIWNCLQATGEIVGYSVFGRVDVVGIKFYQKFVEEFGARSLKDRVIATPNKRTMDYIFKDVKPGFHQLAFQNIRTIPENKLFIAGDTMIYNNVYAVSYWPVSPELGEGEQGHEVVGVEIENPDFVKHELSIFELLWSLAKPIS